MRVCMAPVRQVPAASQRLCRGRRYRPGAVMTDRLYYTDAYLTAFDATVVSSSVDDAGRRLLVLDRTAFYPTSGGQPFDTGRLSGLQVAAVEDTDHGDVIH